MSVSNTVSALSEDAINDGLSRAIPEGGVRAEVHDCVDSTNTVLKTAALNGAEEGKVVIARRQTAGRGRMGRSFYSPEGSGLYVSILVRPRLTADDCLLITPLAAVATSRALEASGCPETAIKWVNDIYVGGKKGAGILVEGSFSPDGCLDHAVVGIGINLYQPDGGFPHELGDIASSFFDGRSVDVNRLAVDLIRELWTLYRALPDRRFMDEYRRRSFLLGESVTVERGGEIYLGKAVDIDDSARLIVECDDGVRRKFDSGEARARGLQI